MILPSLKHNMVGSCRLHRKDSWLLYELAAAGFNCHDASVGSYGYNV